MSYGSWREVDSVRPVPEPWRLEEPLDSPATGPQVLDPTQVMGTGPKSSLCLLVLSPTPDSSVGRRYPSHTEVALRSFFPAYTPVQGS